MWSVPDYVKCLKLFWKYLKSEMTMKPINPERPLILFI